MRDCGYFELPGGIPDEYYAFTDGELSATVERHGGINSISCLDILEKDGKRYPDRGRTPAIFRKEGNVFGKRPVAGPAVQFISTNEGEGGLPGRNLQHFPEHARLYPFGFRGESSRLGHRVTYEMAIVGRDIFFSFTNRFPSRRELKVVVNKSHILQGPAYTLKHQLAEAGDNLDDPPFPEKQSWEQKWDFIGFDARLNGLVMEGVMRFAYGDKGAVVLLASDRQIGFSETEDQYFLTIPWAGHREIRLCLTMAETRREAGRRSGKSLANLRRIVDAKIARCVKYSAGAPEFSAERFPDARVFSRTAPSFLRAMILAETGTEACIRAAADKYGFFNLWDQVWPARAFVLMGDWATAAKLIRYPLSLLRGNEKKYEIIYLALFEILISEDILAVSGNRRFMESVYPELRRLFTAYLGRAGKEGFLAAGSSCGVDHPEQLGIKGEVWPSCLNSQWYCACRAMENLALDRGDAEIAGRARAQGELIRKNYLKTFYEPASGYLCSCIDPQTGKPISIHMNVATLGMDFAYCDFLLHPRLAEIAAYQAGQLYHPAGRSAVAYYDPAYEMWKNVIMFQHLAHEMRTARAAGLGAEIERMMGVYLGHFRRNKTALETQNLSGENGDISQRSNWQAFGARALYSGIVESLIGIQCDAGGFGYAPCEGSGRMAMSNFRFRRGIWDIEIGGRGPYVRSFEVDGKKIVGTLKVPARYLGDKGRHRLRIERGSAPFKVPTLVSAAGAAIEGVSADKKVIEVRIGGAVHCSCKFYVPFRPSADLDGEKLECEYDPRSGAAWVDIIAKANSILRISKG